MKMKPKLKLVFKRQYRPDMIYRAFIVYRKQNITAKRQRPYATIEAAVLGATKWIIRDGQAGSKIMIWHRDSGQEIAVVKMTSLGNIRTTYPWGKVKC